MDVTATGSLGEAELPRSVVSVLRREAVSAAPEEACGLLVGVRAANRVRVTRVVPCANDLPAERRARRFAIDPRRVIEEERATRDSAEEVVGFYHSHPVGEPIPSSVDRGFMALWPDALWVIVGPESDEGSVGIRGWVAGSDPSEPPGEVPIETRPIPRGSVGNEPSIPDLGEGNEGT